jgi:hypothetical protein
MHHHAVSASVPTLYYILGFPSPEVPNSLSRDKLDTPYNHQYKELCTMIDTRRMEVTTLAPKRAPMIALLEEWIPRKSFNLREISSLHGSPESLTRCIKWARPLFFVLQNAFRLQLMARYHILEHRYNTSDRASSLEASLLPALFHRLDGLIGAEQAQFL